MFGLTEAQLNTKSSPFLYSHPGFPDSVVKLQM